MGAPGLTVHCNEVILRQRNMKRLLLLILLGSLPTTVSAQWAGWTPITLVFGGDCTFAQHFDRAIGDDVLAPFSALPILASADLAMVNLENPITTRGRKVPKTFNFRMHPRYLASLIAGGVDIVTIANNHVMDYGPLGLFDTRRFLDSVGIAAVGAGSSEAEARRPVILSRHGTRVGFLAYNAFSNATGSHPGTAPRILSVVTEDVRALRESGTVDIIVVNFHWGTERAPFPDEDQVRFAHAVIDAGADLIVGHHPHVLQGVERYRQGLIAYSLGNFIFGGNSRPRHDSMLLAVTYLGGIPLDARIVPIRVENWRARLLDADEARPVIELVRERSRNFARSLFDE